MIALLTDFGQSEYVGVLKGVIYSVNPEAQVVDLCHEVSPQSIIEAAWILRNNYAYFPRGTVFCCVVDPGVGTARRALAVKTEDYFFAAPDNGLLWETLNLCGRVDARVIPVGADASRTFHGRDVFAGAAARIDKGGFGEFAEPAGEIARLEFHSTGREGMVVRIDRFGNIVTNLPRLDKKRYAVGAGGREWSMAYHATYEGAREGEPFVIEGSCGTLEISIRNGDANGLLGLEAGDIVTIS